MLKTILAVLCLARAAHAAGQAVLGFTWSESAPPTALLATQDGGFLAAVGPEIGKFDGLGRKDPSFRSALQASPLYPAKFLVSDQRGNVFVGPYAVVEGMLYGLVKLRGDGGFAQEFRPVAVTFASQSAAGAIAAISSDGKGGAYVGGTFTALNGVAAIGLAHVDATGQVYPMPNGGRLGSNTPTFLAKMAAGVLVVTENDAFLLSDAGEVRELETPDRGRWVRVRGGAADPQFGVALGVTYLRNGLVEEVVSVWNYDGTLNRKFKNNVIFGAYPPVAMQWDERGRLLGLSARVAEEVGVSTDDGNLWGPKRMMSDGTLDPRWSRTLGFDGAQSCACVLRNGDVLVGGTFSRVAGADRQKLVRLTGDDDNAATRVPTSVRGRVAPNQPLVMGIVVSDIGSSVDALIRAISPGLRAFGVESTVSGTRFSVYRGSARVGLYTSQANTRSAEFVAAQVGAIPIAGGHTEAEALVSLEPGVYTIVLEGVSTEQGDVLGEVYYPH